MRDNRLLYPGNGTSLALDKQRCRACGACGYACPHAVFSFDNKGIANIQFPQSCMECGACAKNCPFGAISVRSGVGCATAVINGMLRNSEPNCDCGSDQSAGSCGGASCC